MQLTSTQLDQQAEHLLEQARAYAYTACQYLSLTNLDLGRSELDEAVEEFQIKYLFPNLEEHEREMLLAFRYSTRSLRITIKAAQHMPASIPEAIITKRETFYMEAKQWVGEMLPKLTPVQQQILQGPLFSIKW